MSDRVPFPGESKGFSPGTRDVIFNLLLQGRRDIVVFTPSEIPIVEEAKDLRPYLMDTTEHLTVRKAACRVDGNFIRVWLVATDSKGNYVAGPGHEEFCPERSD